MVPSDETQNKLTYGQKAVGIKFNPSDNIEVDSIKGIYASVIDSLYQERCASTNSEKIRLLSIAITEAQSAQMWAVKAITWKVEE